MNTHLVVLLALIMFCVASCEEVPPSLEDTKVSLLAPANNVESTDSVQTFYWEELEDSARYQLQVVSPRFDSIVRLAADTLVSRNRLTLQLRRDTYEWRVRALNSNGASMFSNVFRLTIR